MINETPSNPIRMIFGQGDSGSAGDSDDGAASNSLTYLNKGLTTLNSIQLVFYLKSGLQPSLIQVAIDGAGYQDVTSQFPAQGSSATFYSKNSFSLQFLGPNGVLPAETAWIFEGSVFGPNQGNFQLSGGSLLVSGAYNGIPSQNTGGTTYSELNDVGSIYNAGTVNGPYLVNTNPGGIYGPSPLYFSQSGGTADCLLSNSLVEMNLNFS